MAAEFEADPEASASRLTWAQRVVQDCYGRPDPGAIRCRAIGHSAVEFSAGPDPGSGHRVAPRCPFTASRYRRSVS
jgi:hypothetical protein